MITQPKSSFSLRKTTLLLTIFASLLFMSANITAQEKYEAPQLSSPNSWSMILLPDPQTYVKFGRNQPIFELMTAWISENINHLNIKMVLCPGDLVEQNEMINPDGIVANQPSKQQWESVSRAFERLDGKVPYLTALGNHDYGFKNIENRKSYFNQYFPVDQNHLNQKILREVALNAEGIPTLENAVFEFTSPHGREMLFVTMEFAPRDEIIDWAKRIINTAKYKDHTVVLLTHSYLEAPNKHIVKENYPIKEGNYGEAVFDKLVKPSSNIQMVFSGHIGSPYNFQSHVAFRTDYNAANQKVQQITFNAQALGGG